MVTQACIKKRYMLDNPLYVEIWFLEKSLTLDSFRYGHIMFEKGNAAPKC